MTIFKFIKKIILLLSVVALFVVGVDLISPIEPMRSVLAKVTDSEDYLLRDGPNEMFPYIEKVLEQDQSHILIIGDSICRQLFNELAIQNEEIAVAASNAAVTVPGQYMLAMAYLDNHPGATDIYLIMHPHSLLHTFSSSTEYQYAVMPFVEKDLFSYLDEYSLKCISETYGKLFLNKEIVNLIDHSAINRKIYLNYIEKTGKGYQEKVPFEIADGLLVSLQKECINRGVNLHLYSSPVTTYFEADMKEKQNEYECTELAIYYPQYMKDIVYIPSEYTNDMAHFAEEYIDKEMFMEIISEILPEDMVSLFIEDGKSEDGR